MSNQLSAEDIVRALLAVAAPKPAAAPNDHSAELAALNKKMDALGELFEAQTKALLGGMEIFGGALANLLRYTIQLAGGVDDPVTLQELLESLKPYAAMAETLDRGINKSEATEAAEESDPANQGEPEDNEPDESEPIADAWLEWADGDGFDAREETEESRQLFKKDRKRSTVESETLRQIRHHISDNFSVGDDERNTIAGELRRFRRLGTLRCRVLQYRDEIGGRAWGHVQALLGSWLQVLLES